jgi:hypothetical protein
MTRAKPERPIDELRAAIAALQGRPTASENREYLERRLADLEQLQKEGKLRTRHSESAVPMSFSLPASAPEAISRIVEREKLANRSDLIKRALAEWCERHGYRDEAADFLAS